MLDCDDQGGPSGEAHRVRSLLEALETDFAASNATSCEMCLRSKTMPHANVMHVMTQSSLCHPSILVHAHRAICRTITSLSSSQSLKHMTRLATALRFVQLLMYLPQYQHEQKQQKSRSPLGDTSINQNHNHTNATAKADASLPLEKTDQMVTEIVTIIGQVTCRLLEEWTHQSNNEDNDDTSFDPLTLNLTKSTDPRPVACFVLSSLLKLKHLHGNRPQWVVPIFRIATNIALQYYRIDTKSLPQKFVQDSMQSIIQMVDEGTAAMTLRAAEFLQTGQVSVHPQAHAHNSRTLRFLVNKVIALWPLLDDDDEESTIDLKTLWKILTTLRGLSVVLRLTSRATTNSSSAAFLQTFHTTAHKLEKALLSALRTPQLRAVWLRPLLGLVLKPKPKEDVKSAMVVVTKSRMIGRALLLQGLLQKVAGTPQIWTVSQDVDCLLRVCETYHSTVLPQCLGSLAFLALPEGEDATGAPIPRKDVVMLLEQLLWNASRSMTAVLRQVEVSLVDAAPRAQLYRLWIRWMAGMPANSSKTVFQHGLTREFLLWTLYNLVLSTWKEPQTLPPPTSQALHPLLSLMVQLLFDRRTALELRQALSTLLSWLLTCPNDPDYTAPRQALAESLREASNIIVDHALDESKNRRKRKKSHDAKKDDQNTVRYYTSGHLEAIGRVLSHVPASISRKQEHMDWLVEEISSGKAGQSTSKTRSMAILMWSLHQGAMKGSMSKSFFSSLIQRLTRQATKLSRGKSLDDSSHAMTLASLSLVQEGLSGCSEQLSSTSIPIKDLCQLLLILTRGPPNQPQKSRLILASLDLLIPIAKAIPDSATDEIQMIKTIFLQLFAIENDIILARTLDTLAKFGRTVSRAHAKMLPSMLPQNRVPAFQARAQNMIWKKDRSVALDNSIRSLDAFGWSLNKLVVPRGLGKNIFPVPKSFQIELGSYFVSMPTQDGRHALVIFPPTADSLVDIRYMYGVQEDEEVADVHALRRLVLAENGSCRCLLGPTSS